jgi:hypothetical protein
LEDGTVLSPFLWHTVWHNRLEKHILLDRLVERQIMMATPAAHQVTVCLYTRACGSAVGQ